MQLKSLYDNEMPRIVSKQYGPATIKIFFPSSRQVYEYVIYDDFTMNQLIKKHTKKIAGRPVTNVGGLVADLKKRSYEFKNVTSNQ